MLSDGSQTLHTLFAVASCLVAGPARILPGMTTKKPPLLTAEVHQFETPDWGPLRAAVGMKLADCFMWMCEYALDDGRRIHAYKHHLTRRYLHLGAGGEAYQYCHESFFIETSVARAIPIAFEMWEAMTFERVDGSEVDDAIRRALAA